MRVTFKTDKVYTLSTLVTLYLRYLNDDANQYNLAAYATLINFHRLCWILYTCYDVVVFVKSETAEVNAVQNSNVF